MAKKDSGIEEGDLRSPAATGNMLQGIDDSCTVLQQKIRNTRARRASCHIPLPGHDSKARR